MLVCDHELRKPYIVFNNISDYIPTPASIYEIPIPMTEATSPNN